MAFYRERDLINLAKEIGSEGVGTAGGFILGGFIGRQVENFVVKTPVTETSTLLNKAFAWGANNGSKAVIYLIAKKYDAHSSATSEATKALLGSVVYDTLIRLTNKGINPANAMIGQFRILGEDGKPVDVNQLKQENSILRTELNKALRTLSELPPSPRITDMPGYNPDRPDMRGDFRQATVLDPTERQKEFGSMPVSPAVAERNRKYGAMPFVEDPNKISRERKYGFAGNMSDKEEVLKVFNMQ